MGQKAPPTPPQPSWGQTPSRIGDDENDDQNGAVVNILGAQLAPERCSEPNSTDLNLLPVLSRSMIPPQVEPGCCRARARPIKRLSVKKRLENAICKPLRSAQTTAERAKARGQS